MSSLPGSLAYFGALGSDFFQYVVVDAVWIMGLSDLITILFLVGYTVKMGVLG